MHQYLRIVHKGRGFNVRVELPDHSTQLVPVAELNSWELVKDSSIRTENKGSKEKEDIKSKPKLNSFRKNTNGLGIDHPYEAVDTNVEEVEYEEEVYVPF